MFFPYLYFTLLYIFCQYKFKNVCKKIRITDIFKNHLNKIKSMSIMSEPIVIMATYKIVIMISFFIVHVLLNTLDLLL